MRAALSAACAALLLVAACTSAHRGGQSSSPVLTDAPPSASIMSSSRAAPTSPASPAPLPYPDWPTYHGTADRAGVSATMPAVTAPPRVVATVPLDAAVYASPLVVGGTVIAATENDSVYAVSLSGRVLWRASLGRPARRSELPCGNIDPSGITGTPAYSASTGLVYVAAEFGSPVRHSVVALDAHTGRVAWTRPLGLPGTAQDAMQERGALAIAGGRVWVPFGGRAGDCGNYRGTVLGLRLDGSGDVITYTVPTPREGGIWTPPGPSVDEHGRLYVAVGNGAAGAGDAYDYSDSVVELDASGRRISSFSPSSWAADNDADLDLGSQGPALVGSYVFQAGKSGTAYVLRRDALGGIGGAVSSATVCRSFGGTAVDGSVVYVPCTDGVAAVRVDAAGRMAVLWRADQSITGSPVVGGGRVWSLDVAAGVLHALDPRTGRPLAHVAVGAVTRFATPAIYGPDLIVPTTAGLTITRA